MKRRDLESRIQKLEQEMRPTPERTVVVRLVSDHRDLDELPEAADQWLTYPAAAAKADRTRGVQIIYLDSDDERRARKARSA